MENGNHVNGGRRRFTTAEKIEILAAARATTVKDACAQFNVSPSSIHLWRQMEAKLVRARPTAKRMSRELNSHHEMSHPTTTPLEPSHSSPPQLSSLTVDPTQPPSSARVSAGAILAAPTVPGNFLGGPTPDTQHTHTDQRVNDTSASTHTDDEPTTAPGVEYIGFQGEQNGFPEMAAQRTIKLLTTGTLSTGGFETIGYPNAVHMLDALNDGEILFGILHTDVLQSTTCRAPLDRVVSSRLQIVGEFSYPERVWVCSLPGTRLSESDCIMSDWQVLSRYEEYILRLERRFGTRIHRHIVWDSATACRMIREEQAAKTLVLCSEEAARANGLVVIERANSIFAVAKYAIIGRRDAPSIQLNKDAIADAVSHYTREASFIISSRARTDLTRITHAFARVRLSIEHISVRSDGSARPGQSCLITYRGPSSTAVETLPANQIAGVADRVIFLGNYFSYTMHDRG